MGRKKSFTNRKKQNKRKYEKQSPLPSKATCCTLQQTSTRPVFPPNISHNQQILRRLTILPLGWTIVSTGTSSDDKIVLCYIKTPDTDKTVTIPLTVTILNNLTYTLSAFNHHNIQLPNTLQIQDINSLINVLNYTSQLHICPGNSLPRHVQLAELRGGIMFNRQG